MNSIKTNFTYIGKAQVTKDKLEDAYEIEVTLVEAMPSLEGDYNEKETKDIEYKDSKGNTLKVKKDKSKTITAKWINIYNSNRISAPDVVIGEIVHIYQEGGNDEYFWASSSMNLRKKEKVIFAFANKNESLPNEDTGDKQYYILVDTKNKEIVLHTDSSDGELSHYDFIINTGDGIVTLIDKQGNYVELKSVDGILNIKLNNDINITHDRDMTITTGNNQTIKIGNDSSITIGNNLSTSVGGNTTHSTSGTVNQSAGSSFTITGKPVLIN